MEKNDRAGVVGKRGLGALHGSVKNAQDLKHLQELKAILSDDIEIEIPLPALH